MEMQKDHPGVYFPPPLLYVAIFLISVLIDHFIRIDQSFFSSTIGLIASVVFIIAGFALMFPAVITFFQTKNSLIPIKAATSLQTSGVYAFSRNPMYLGLLLIYVGLAFLIGNWWTLLFVPLLVVLINKLIILKEESYLERAFGAAFIEYKKKVRQWL
jgi:protein-S-isoprenylcysteine O-methyltransferase Ste14